MHWGARQNKLEKPKDKDEVNKQGIHECDGRTHDPVEMPIDSGIGLSIRIDNLRVFINKTLSTESLINQLLIKRACLSISIDSR